MYGISQNPNTEDYILVQKNYHIWISGNEKIDDFIQERQLKTSNYDDIVLEWIPYNQFYYEVERRQKAVGEMASY